MTGHCFGKAKSRILLTSTTLLLLFFLCAKPLSVCAQQYTATVVGIADGDTLHVLFNGKPARVRLAGIDCPEKSQPFGSKAKQFTSDLVFGKEVTISVEGKDKYGRMLGNVILPDGTSLNHNLVRAGYAWWYRRFSHDKELAALEAEAQYHNRGLWADSTSIAPWQFRKENKERHK